MRLSEFWFAVSEEFGESYGRVITRDLVLAQLGDRTADAALGAGVPAREVWLALCVATDIPRERWYGAGKPAPRQSR